MHVRVLIPLEPHAQMRPRTRVVVPSSGGRPFATVYDPPESEKWKQEAAAFMRIEMRKQKLAPLVGPLRVRILAVFELAKSHHRKQPVPRSLYTGVKDWDNIGKATCDAANEALYGDDRQIAWPEMRLFVGAQGEKPHVIIRVDVIESLDLRWPEVEDELPVFVTARPRIEPGQVASLFPDVDQEADAAAQASPGKATGEGVATSGQVGTAHATEAASHVPRASECSTEPETGA